MATRKMNGLFALLAGSLLAGCLGLPKERVLSRLPSPDGRLEAVLMECRDPATSYRLNLVGGVFNRVAGQTFDCDFLMDPNLQASFVASVPSSSPERESVEWNGGRAIFTLYGRGVITGSRRTDRPAVMEVQALEPPTPN
jgi:hypothetical protein